jgi:hypothetical protein
MVKLSKLWGEPAFCIKPSLPYLKQFTTGDVSQLPLPAPCAAQLQ